MKLINRHPNITITITIAFITAALILLSHVSLSEQQQHSSSAESLSSDVDDDDHDQQHQHHHHVDLQPPEVPSSAEAAESAHSEEEDSNSFELPSLSSTESESPESAPFEAPPEEPPPPPPSFEAQQSGNDAKEEQKEPILSTQTAATSDQPPPPQKHSSEEQPPSSATFSDLLAQYTPSMEQSQQTVEAVKRNGLLAYDYLQSAVLHLATLVPSVLVDSHDDSTTKSEGGNGPSGTSKRPRENYALLSRFSWSALCSYYQSLARLELELFCSTETAIAGVGVLLLLLIFLLIRYTVGRGRPPKEEEVSENCTDPLSPSSSSSTASQSASPASSGLFSRLLRFLNLTILFSNLTSYVDGAFRSFRSSEAVVTQTSHGHAGVYSMQGRRPNMEDCFTLRNNISRELGIDYYAVFDGHGGPNAALQAEREIFENISRRIRELVAGEANKENNSSSQEQQQQLSKSKSVPSSPTKPTSSSSSSEGSCPATPSTPSTSSSPLTFSSMLNSGKAAANNLSHNNLRPFDSLTVNAMKTILHEEITAVDAKLVEAFRRRGDISGTTAVIAVRLVHSNLLLVANVGDSRAVLCDWKGQAIVLSVDHKPYQLKEYRRIVEAGGYIMLKGVYRVNGILAVSRALGDYPLKEDRLVIADPDILSFDLTELRARFMIIASDGFFDCFSNENAVQFVRGELARHGTVNMGESQAGLALYLAKRLANEAYTRESYDNITIIVVLFEDVSGGGGGVQVKGVGQATCPSGGSSPTTKTAPTPLPTTTSPKTSTSTTTT